MLCEIMKPDFQNFDNRGVLVQLVSQGYSQVNYIFSKEGCVRGGHYHHINTEAFYVIRGEVNLTLAHGAKKEKHTFQTGDMFKIPPGVKHTFYYIKHTELISLYDGGIEFVNGEKDFYC